MRATSLLTACLGVLLVGLLWPAALGGRATYLVISGASMEPLYHTGDLVIVRRQASYGTGDVAAFRTDGGDVIHRIVGGSAEDGYVFRGDNRTAVDPWRPRPEQIVGRAWLHVPGLGRHLYAARQTGALPLLGGSAVVLALTGASDRRRKRLRRARRRRRARTAHARELA